MAQSLKDKLAQMRKAKLKQVSSNTNTDAATNAPANVPSKPNALDNLSLELSTANDKLAEHIAKQEEAGVYTFSGKMNEIEGLDADTFISKMKALDAATLEKTPDIRNFCMYIRRNLQQYPELTHILSDDQLGILVGGMLEVAGVETAPKTKASKARKDTKDIETLASMSLTDLGL